MQFFSFPRELFLLDASKKNQTLMPHIYYIYPLLKRLVSPFCPPSSGDAFDKELGAFFCFRHAVCFAGCTYKILAAFLKSRQ